MYRFDLIEANLDLNETCLKNPFEVKVTTNKTRFKVIANLKVVAQRYYATLPR